MIDLFLSIYSLAKRAVIATQTLVVDGKTVVQVIDAGVAVATAIATEVSTVTETEYDNSYICK